MLDQDALRQLLAGVESWNQWRILRTNTNERINISGVNLGGANLKNANLRWVNLTGADLTRACLTGADLLNTNLTGANLTEADLQEVDLAGRLFERINLSGANLHSVNAQGAHFIRANLTGADLSGANLSGANFRGSSLNSANLSGTNIKGADFRETQLTGAEFTGSRIDEWTRIDTEWRWIWRIDHGRVIGRNLLGSELTGNEICLCGSRFNSTHTADCPRPLDIATASLGQRSAWSRARDLKRAKLAAVNVRATWQPATQDDETDDWPMTCECGASSARYLGRDQFNRFFRCTVCGREMCIRND